MRKLFGCPSSKRLSVAFQLAASSSACSGSDAVDPAGAEPTATPVVVVGGTGGPATVDVGGAPSQLGGAGAQGGAAPATTGGAGGATGGDGGASPIEVIPATGGMNTGTQPDAGGGDPGAPMCVDYDEPSSRGKVDSDAIKESSGLVASQANPGALWTHDDSGNEPRIFALNTRGVLLATIEIDGTNQDQWTDWEDIAVGPGPDDALSYLYIGDIGDNDKERGDNGISVYQFPEPSLDIEERESSVSGAVRLDFEYPDGARNAETLMIDPVSGDLLIVSKDEDSGYSEIYRASAPFDSDKTTTLKLVGSLKFGSGELSGDKSLTGGDISATGDLIGLRSYDDAFLWRRQDGQSVAEALSADPCASVELDQNKGESLAFAVDGSGFFLSSESENEDKSEYNDQPLYFVSQE